MYYKPSIDIQMSLPDDSPEDFTGRVNARLAELSDRHVIEDVQLKIGGSVAYVLIRYREDQWAPKEYQ